MEGHSGCGSGQGTFQLLEHFKQCLGIDISRAQVKEAQEKASSMEVKENVMFLVGDAAELPVESGTVDLVTAAAAWHWFPDKNKFYSECKRVLKQNGCLAVYSYTRPHLPVSYYSTNKLIDLKTILAVSLFSIILLRVCQRLVCQKMEFAARLSSCEV